MVQAFATGKRALGICDNCGFRYLVNELKETFVQGKPTGLRVCDSCFDPDHPQNFQGTTPIDDPQALRVSRPDVAEAAVPPYVPPPINPSAP